MSAGKAIYAKLNSLSAITDLVQTRILPELTPEQMDFPVIVYSVESAGQDQSYAGPCGPGMYVVELVAISKSPDPSTPGYATVDQICAALKSALDGAGAYGEMWGTTEVQGCWFENEDDDVTTLGDAKGAKFFLKAQRYTIAAK